MLISKEEVEHVAMLARLELTDEEKELYTSQLNVILEHVHLLNQLDTSAVEPTAHVLPLQNVFRADAIQESMDRELALQNAPAREDGTFKVPRIV